MAGPQLWITALALAAGTFMQVLDSTIANVSLPTIAGNLGVSSESGTWVITSFACANGVTVPLTGWLMGRFGVVRTFTAAIVAFTISSLLCGIAPSLPALIVFRIFQGGCSGPIIPGSQALLISIFPPDKRPVALAVWAITTMVAPIMGPVLGGYIVDHYNWGWIFLLNVPVGIVVGMITWRNLASRETPRHKVPIDKIGMLLLVFWVFCLQAVLDLGKDRDWFHNSMITVLTIISAIGFIAWLIWELTDRQPAVDLNLFKRRNFSFAVIAICLGYGVFFANNLLLPLWLQVYNGYTASWAGLVSAPSGAVAILATLLVTRIRADPRMLATVCFLLYAASYYMRSEYTPDASFWTLTMPLLLQGAAMSMFFVQLTVISLDGLPPERFPSASGLSNFARLITGSFAASICQTSWDRRAALHQSRLTEVATPYSPVYNHTVSTMQAIGASPLQGAGAVLHDIVTQAYLLASLEIFRLSAWLVLAMIPVVWLCRRPKPMDHVVIAD